MKNYTEVRGHNIEKIINELENNGIDNASNVFEEFHNDTAPEEFKNYDGENEWSDETNFGDFLKKLSREEDINIFESGYDSEKRKWFAKFN